MPCDSHRSTLASDTGSILASRSFRGAFLKNDVDDTAVQCWNSIQANYGVNACTVMSMLSESLRPSACETDVTGALSMYALQLASGLPSALVDWNNNYGAEEDRRNALLCLACGVATLLLHLEWRRSGATRPLLLALVVLAVGLGCGEAALGAVAYVILGWRLLYLSFGYEVRGSTLYVDPVANGVAALLWRLLHAERLARFWALGMAASIVPVCGAFPMDRLLVFAGVGAFGLMFVFVNGNDFPVVYTHIIRTARGEPAPRRVALLAPLSASLVRREDARTLVISPEDGSLPDPWDRLLSSPTRRFSAGETIERPDFVADVRSVTADGRPLEVAFRFRRPLEDPQVRWLYWVDGRVREFPLPGQGRSVAVAASPLIQ